MTTVYSQEHILSMSVNTLDKQSIQHLYVEWRQETMTDLQYKYTRLLKVTDTKATVTNKLIKPYTLRQSI